MTWRGQAVPGPGRKGEQPDVVTVILPGFLDTTSTDITSDWFRFPADFALDGASIHFTAKVAPASAIAIMLQKSVNGGTSFSNILTGNLSLSGHVQDVNAPNWTGGDLHKGDLLRVQLNTADSACAGVMIQIVHL